MPRSSPSGGFDRVQHHHQQQHQGILLFGTAGSLKVLVLCFWDEVVFRAHKKELDLSRIHLVIACLAYFAANRPM